MLVVPYWRKTVDLVVVVASAAEVSGTDILQTKWMTAAVKSVVALGCQELVRKTVAAVRAAGVVDLLWGVLELGLLRSGLRLDSSANVVMEWVVVDPIVGYCMTQHTGMQVKGVRLGSMGHPF